MDAPPRRDGEHDVARIADKARDFKPPKRSMFFGNLLAWQLRDSQKHQTLNHPKPDTPTPTHPAKQTNSNIIQV